MRNNYGRNKASAMLTGCTQKEPSPLCIEVEDCTQKELIEKLNELIINGTK